MKTVAVGGLGVLLVLWGRRSVEQTGAELFGDAELLGRLRAAGAF